MIAPLRIDNVLDSSSKLAVLRVLASRKGFKATGREIAKLAGYSVPSTHESLKDLHAKEILLRDIIGKQHVYSLNEENRLVKKVIRPVFQAENGFKEEVRNFLLKELKRFGIKPVSLILYGSVQKGNPKQGSDIDIAVVTAHAKKAEEAFISIIAPRFHAYFGAHLDPYVKPAAEFRQRLKKDQPPVSTLMKSYSVLYGKEPLEV